MVKVIKFENGKYGLEDTLQTLRIHRFCSFGMTKKRAEERAFEMNHNSEWLNRRMKIAESIRKAGAK